MVGHSANILELDADSEDEDEYILVSKLDNFIGLICNYNRSLFSFFVVCYYFNYLMLLK